MQMEQQKGKVEEKKAIRELSPEDLAEWIAWREEDDRAWRMFTAYGQVAA